MILIDAPGYGYAKGNSQELESWGKMIVKYLKHGEFYHRALCLIDAEHGLKDSDLMLFELLEKYSKPFVVCLTKCDKITEKQLENLFQDISLKLKTFQFCSPIIIATSSKYNLSPNLA